MHPVQHGPSCVLSASSTPCFLALLLLLRPLVLLVSSKRCIPLLLDTLQLPVAGSLGLVALGLHLLLQDTLTLLLGLGLVDLMRQESGDLSNTPSQTTGSAYMLNQRTLVFECVTLAQMVELVVEVFVDLARGPIFD